MGKPLIYMPGQPIMAQHAPEQTVISAQMLLAGEGFEMRDSVVVPPDHWCWFDPDEMRILDLDDATFRNLYAPLGRAGFFIQKTRPVRVACEGTTAYFADQPRTIPTRTFLAGHVRCDAQGNPVCAATWPLSEQARLLKQRRGGDGGHLDALREIRDAHLKGVISDPAILADIHLFDALMADLGDDVPQGLAEIAAAAHPQRDETGRPLPASALDRMVKATGLPPGALIGVSESSAYRDPTTRGMIRRQIAEHLGGRALEDVVAAFGPASNVVAGWASRGELVARLPPKRLPEMPGYETSPVTHWRRDGLDVLTFDDVFGVYAYAWRTPEPKPEHEPPAPRGF